jgi:hypothetical protein
LFGIQKDRGYPNQLQTLRTATGLDHGAITAFVAVATTAVAVLIAAVSLAFQYLVMQQKLVASVDLAALAAADTQRGLVSGVVCENAESILKTVDAVMTTCRIVGDGVMVSGQLSLTSMTLEASAIAGEK